MTAAIAVAVVAVVAIAGCGTDLDGSGQSATTGSGVAPAPSLDRFYGQQLHWESCDDYADQEAYGYPADRTDCTTVTVPVDYDNPDGESARLALLRVRASGDKIGSLLMNPGGPGGSGVEYMAGRGADLAELELGDRFDLIGFDPRGIGLSTPQIRCLTDTERDEQRAVTLADMTPEGIAEQEQEAKDTAGKCEQEMGSEFLAHVGTADVVKDLDVLRAVLGDDKLNYLGYSYGTRIGAAYAEEFPTKVRAMVNDGAVDPAADPVEDTVKQMAGFQSAFDAFAADCAAGGACPLGDDPARATTRFQELARPLIDRPAPTGLGRSLSYEDAITGVVQALYSDGLWDPLREGLVQLTRGNGDTLLRLADMYEGRDSDGHYANMTDVFTAVRCVDDPPITDQATLDRLDTEGRRAAPFSDDGRGTGVGVRDECAFWPVPPTSVPHQLDVAGLPTTVVVSTTNDPATPYDAGVTLAKSLNARLITFEGDQHTASLEGKDCVDDAVIAYLVDLTLPDEGLRC
jgi:pimeloyl-ACP methyl ester carboxylesterase